MLVTITKKTAIIIECDELTIEFVLLLIENLVYPVVYMDLCVYDNLEGCLNQFNRLVGNGKRILKHQTILCSIEYEKPTDQRIIGNTNITFIELLKFGTSNRD